MFQRCSAAKSMLVVATTLAFGRFALAQAGADKAVAVKSQTGLATVQAKLAHPSVILITSTLSAPTTSDATEPRW